LRVPTRDDLSTHRVRGLHAGGPTKADLSIVDLGEGPMVVKDFRDKAWWVRVIGRIQIAREARAYRWLGDHPGLPRFVGRIDAHAMAMELIDGEQATLALDRVSDRVAMHRRLTEIVESLHEAGMVHLDLRGRENVILGRNGELYVLDLASAVWTRPGGVPHRLFHRWLRLTDVAALLKWKRLLAAGAYTAEEEAFLERYRFWRALWPFNRKFRRGKQGS
jgi:serine/threonine protein kinase